MGLSIVCTLTVKSQESAALVLSACGVLWHCEGGCDATMEDISWWEESVFLRVNRYI